MAWAGHVACISEKKNAYIIPILKPEMKRPLGIPRHRWEDSIRKDLRELERDGLEWIHVT
jgi:hypothetical protein